MALSRCAEMTMREQDEHLLQHLLHMGYNIRRLKRVRWLHTAGRTSSCGMLGARSGNAPPQGTVPGGRDGVSLLHRQHSEPGLTMFPRRLSVVTSSASIETIADLEEMDSLYGSATDLDVDSMPVDMATPTGMRRSSSAFAALTFTPEELTSVCVCVCRHGVPVFNPVQMIMVWEMQVMTRATLVETYHHPQQDRYRKGLFFYHHRNLLQTVLHHNVQTE
nr:hypothetical protein BaRGS_006452 [Batillaria attramentaria]